MQVISPAVGASFLLAMAPSALKAMPVEREKSFTVLAEIAGRARRWW